LFSESARYYDLIYGEFKDFEKEADEVAGLLRDVAPGVRTLLDLGCGTGRHAAALTRKHGYAVDGLDVEPAFVEIAGERCPRGRFSVEDMAEFNLGRTYDAVICLFSSIGYVKTRDRLVSTVASIRRHLEPGGLALVEPWFTPDAFHPGKVSLTTARGEGVQISRMSWSRVQDGISILDFHYLVGTDAGVRHLQETHELALFTQEEMVEGLRAGGLELEEYRDPGLTDRGLYLARKPPMA
jgi:SAM-dependent methyltransferase